MKRFVTDFRNYFKYSIYSAKSALNAEVAGSYLNWLWWVFNPICMMLIYTFIFGFVFNGKEQYFPIFIFIGLTMWDYFNRTVSSSVRLVKKNKAIVTKVYLPKFVLIESTMMVNFFKMLISFIIVVAMMLVWRVPVSWHVFWIIPILAIVSLFIFGIANIIMHFGVFVDDLVLCNGYFLFYHGQDPCPLQPLYAALESGGVSDRRGKKCAALQISSGMEMDAYLAGDQSGALFLWCA